MDKSFVCYQDLMALGFKQHTARDIIRQAKQRMVQKGYPLYLNRNAKGNFYYETELGTDKMSGKRVRKKGRKDSQGMPFSTAFAANKELTRVKREYHEAHGFTNFRMTYRQFMKDAYIPAYKTDVEESTFAVRNRSFDICIARFGDLLLRDIDITDVQNFRTWLGVRLLPQVS